MSLANEPLFRVLIPAAALIVLAGPGKACAEVMHKWFDEYGQVHFSDRAPNGRESETTDITSSSGKGNPGNTGGLREAERQLLGASRRHEKEIKQARRRSASKHAAGKSSCMSARNRYDRAKRKPGAAKSVLARRYFEEMRELCR
jgi:Domain of unknown function (DUF4124)